MRPPQDLPMRTMDVMLAIMGGVATIIDHVCAVCRENSEE
jgi:hypothetical protein